MKRDHNMDMMPRDHIAFRVTGHGPGKSADGPAAMRPALFAHYRDLTALRYDFPLVLVKDGPAEDAIRSLSDVIDGVLQAVAAPGLEGEPIRQHVLRLEKEIRSLTARGVVGSLSALWDKCARRLAAASDDSLENSLARARAALKVDGKLVDCNAALPPRLFGHAWERVQQQRTQPVREKIRALSVKLSDILKAGALSSVSGRGADALKGGVGSAHSDAFDFDMMSRLLARVAGASTLPPVRVRRIEWALEVLHAQRFFRNGDAAASSAPYDFVYTSCAAACEAYGERLPRMVELLKAIAVAQLEAEGRYVEGKHDAFFDAFDAGALDREDLSLFPHYLVCVRWSAGDPADEAGLWHLLSSGIPAKVLVQSDEILAPPGEQEALPFLTARSAHLASMAVGLRHTYVVQAVSANLLQMKDALLKGLHHPGPALFSVYSGCAASSAGIPPYLNAAAAMESRAFPSFRYDPAEADWAAAFSVEGNPEPGADWPTHRLVYEDEKRQRVTEELRFTFADFVACDARYARHYARLPRTEWGTHMVSVADCPAGALSQNDAREPYIALVDVHSALHRALVDDRVVRESERCRAAWRSLQELGGIRNSHAERMLAREKAAWEEQQARELARVEKTAGAKPATAEAVPAVQAAAKPATDAPPPAEPAAPERSSDEAYIETPRCTTCDECTQISNVVFAYDANKQAYIAHPEAATYRELVEAAEACQVSIIHPGKPRNANEPGLAELVERAQPFL